MRFPAVCRPSAWRTSRCTGTTSTTSRQSPWASRSWDSPFFANAENFAARALKAVDENPDPVEWFILNAEANSEMDLTAIDALDSLRQELEVRGIYFGMARVKSETIKALQVGGELDDIGVENIYPTLPTAVEAYRNRGAANSVAPSAVTAAPANTEPDGR